MPSLGPRTSLIHLSRATEHRTTQWAGGETTELAIFPNNGSYASREFDCRISTATERQSGPFTSLPGFKRILCLLQGEGMELAIESDSHKRKEVLARRMDTIRFDGSDIVVAQLLGGPVRDFNVIYRPELSISVSALQLANNERNLSFLGGESSIPQKEALLFCADGNVEVSWAGATVTLTALDIASFSLQAQLKEEVRLSPLGSGATVFAIEIEFPKGAAPR